MGAGGSPHLEGGEYLADFYSCPVINCSFSQFRRKNRDYRPHTGGAGVDILGGFDHILVEGLRTVC